MKNYDLGEGYHGDLQRPSGAHTTWEWRVTKAPGLVVQTGTAVSESEALEKMRAVVTGLAAREGFEEPKEEVAEAAPGKEEKPKEQPEGKGKPKPKKAAAKKTAAAKKK